MTLRWKNLASFLLMLGGAMAFGSLYSALLNRVDIAITPLGIVFTSLTLVFVFAGWYAFGYLSLGKGNRIIAIVLVAIAAILGMRGLIFGKSETQVWFAAHEILNLVLPWIILVQLALHKPKAE